MPLLKGLALSLALAALSGVQVAAFSASSSKDPTPAGEAMRLLRVECSGCHNPSKKKGGLDLTSAEGFRKGSQDGPVLRSKKPELSPLLKVLAKDADPHMPPKKQLAPREIQSLRVWIGLGAPWDAEAFNAEPAPRQVALSPLPAAYVPIGALAVSPDGKTLAGARGGSLFLCDIRDTNAVFKTTQFLCDDAIQSLAWVDGGTRLAVGSFRGIRWIDPANLETTATLTRGLSGRILAMRWNSALKKLFVSDEGTGREGYIRVIASGGVSIERSWKAHDDTVLDLDLSADGTRLATAGGDRLARVWEASSGRELAALEGHTAQVLSVAFNTNATQLATGGADKHLKIFDIATREKVVTPADHLAGVSVVRWPGTSGVLFAANEGGAVFRYNDLKSHTGEQSSATGTETKLGEIGDSVASLAMLEDGSKVFAGSQDGMLWAWDKEGKSLGKIDVRGSIEKAVEHTKPGAEPVSFVRDVLPVLSRAGCNAGACHAKPEGQNGFKLSVFSYDPKADFAEIVKEARGRRIFPAAPGESLLLLKPTGRLPHEGGVRIEPGSEAERLLTQWMREGMAFTLEGEARLKEITVTPKQGRYRKGAVQKLRVTAHYEGGSSRDVTRLAAFDSNDKEIAKVDEQGRMKIGSLTGHGVVVARFMGQVADSQILVPSDRKLPASRYASLPRNNFIDDLAFARFQELGLFPSEPCTDSEFLRRAKLDAIGVLPTSAEARAFLEDRSPDKRARFVETVLDAPQYGDFWAGKWADLIRPNPDRVGVKSVFILDQWLRRSFQENTPLDRFAREILTAQGTNHRDGPAVVYRDRREPPELTTMFSQLFLGVRLECARCHHHPNEKWSQDDFYQFAAFFGPVKQKGAGLSPPISAGTEVFHFTPGGAVKHPVTGEVMRPRPPDGSAPVLAADQDPREALADWLTARGNPFFAPAAVNRVWAQFFGRGLVEPVDDFRISNPCANPALLAALARDFEEHGYDLKHLARRIMSSRLYQLSSTPNESNLADTRNFSRSYRRRLPAEVLLDAVGDITGVPETLAAVPAGGRASQAWSYKIESHFMDAFGRPNASSDCPCDRDRQLSVVQALHLMHSESLQNRLASKQGRVAQWASGSLTPEALVQELYLATLTRMPSREELASAVGIFGKDGATRQSATEDLLWALLNSPEFVLNH